MAQAITVSALNKYVRSVLEGDENLADIAIEGEVSNFSRHYKSGHCYFSLKDAKASIRAVMFRSAAENVGFVPEDGMQVTARGRVTLYERDGAYQLYVEYLFPSGEGAARLAFEQVKARLEAEGLFDAAAKKPLPAWPGHIGLVTSKGGAALQDVLKMSQARCPLVRYSLYPVSVQGAQAAPEIANAIRALDAAGGVDVILVTRGGGSAEDLWVFNDERVARAAFGCTTPVVSAVGHEVDTTILDYVADLRAPTPSAAVEMMLPDLQAAQARALYLLANMQNNIHMRADSCYNILNRAAAHPSLAVAGGLVAHWQGRVARAQAGASQAAALALRQAGRRLAAAGALAAGLNPYGVLARGYAIVRKGGAVLRSAAQAATGDALAIQMGDGRIDCRVEAATQGGAADEK